MSEKDTTARAPTPCDGTTSETGETGATSETSETGETGETSEWCDDERAPLAQFPSLLKMKKDTGHDNSEKDGEEFSGWMTDDMLREISAVSRPDAILGFCCTLREALDDTEEDWRADRYWDVHRDACASDTSDYTEAPSYCSPWNSDDDSDNVYYEGI